MGITDIADSEPTIIPPKRVFIFEAITMDQKEEAIRAAKNTTTDILMTSDIASD